MHKLFLIGSFFGYCSLYAQLSEINSAKSKLENSSSDTTTVNVCIEISSAFQRINIDSTIVYAQRALELSLKNNYRKGEANARLLLGIADLKKGNLKRALEICQTVLKISLENNLRETEARALDNIGLIYNYQGNYPATLEYYQRALSIAESLKDKKIVGGILINIGGLHYNLKDYRLALDYWQRALDQQLTLKDMSAAGSCLNNIGIVYSDQGKYRIALHYYFKSVAMYEQEMICRKVYPFENIGHNYIKLGKLDSAEFFLNQALDGAQYCKNPVVEIGALTGLSEVYELTNRNPNALSSLKAAFNIGMKSGLSREKGISAKRLSQLLQKLGKTTEALNTYKIYSTIQDSIYNNESIKQIGKLEAKYEYDLVKKEQEIAQRIENIEKERLMAKEKWIRNTFVAGFVLMIFVAYMSFRNFQRKQKSNTLLLSLNKEIQDQQKVLISQSEELKTLNETLNTLNHDLEIKVAERTGELNDKNSVLENQNSKLANYAFINAHKLRAPVATIIGLATLFENKNIESKERDEIVDMIRGRAIELDRIVAEIKVILEKEQSQKLQ
jgi:tetratricopeptide (TPR) repeat protein